MSYKKLFLTLICSFFIMYVLMFVNMNSVRDYYTSLTRIYMALMMVTPMAVLMILMMKKMYPNPKYNRTIISISVITFVLALTGLRLQVPVNDEQYLKAMIPHHSSAIMTSRNADIKDPEVRRLADSIISSQQQEITQMNKILERMK